MFGGKGLLRRQPISGEGGWRWRWWVGDGMGTGVWGGMGIERI